MINKFALVVGLSGLAICVACLSASAVIGGKALRDTGFDFGSLGQDRCRFSHSGTPGSRTLAWNGGNKASIELPATVHYRRGSGDQVVIKGDSEVISHVRVNDGKIKLDCRMCRNQRPAGCDAAGPRLPHFFAGRIRQPVPGGYRPAQA